MTETKHQQDFLKVPHVERGNLVIPDNTEIHGIQSEEAGKVESIMKGDLAEREKKLETHNTEYREKLVDTFIGKEERQLYTETYIDPMTGLFNRSALAGLDSLISQGKEVSIVSFDADHFGLLNDHFGTDFGDYLIKTVALHFHEAVFRLRAQGYNVWAVRMGGEEIVLTGECPKAVLAKEMKNLRENLQHDLWHNLSTQQINLLEKAVHKKYGGNIPIEIARNEIGGSTSAVVSIATDQLTEHPYARETMMELVDAVVEHCKDPEHRELLGGRNTVHESKVVHKDIAGKYHVEELTAEDAQERIQNFIPRNILSLEQNRRFGEVRRKLDIMVEQDFLQLCPTCKQALNYYKHIDSRISRDLRIYLESPVSPAKSLINAIGPDKLQELKTEWMQAKQHSEGYTGAASKRRIVSPPEGFSPHSGITIKIDGFRSVNAAGHSNGDTFLIYVYQMIIKPALQKAGIHPSQYICAQKGADFQLLLHNDVQEKSSTIQRLMSQIYIDEMESLDRILSSSDDSDRRKETRPNDRRTHTENLHYSGTLSERRKKWILDHPETYKSPDIKAQQIILSNLNFSNASSKAASTALN